MADRYSTVNGETSTRKDRVERIKDSSRAIYNSSVRIGKAVGKGAKRVAVSVEKNTRFAEGHPTALDLLTGPVPQERAVRIGGDRSERVAPRIAPGPASKDKQRQKRTAVDQILFGY